MEFCNVGGGWRNDVYCSRAFSYFTQRYKSEGVGGFVQSIFKRKRKVMRPVDIKLLHRIESTHLILTINLLNRVINTLTFILSTSF